MKKTTVKKLVKEEEKDKMVFFDVNGTQTDEDLFAQAPKEALEALEKMKK